MNILGVMGSDDEAPKAVSNEDLMEEMKNLNALMGTMREELNANTQQTYKNRLERFDTAIKVLSVDCEVMEGMYANVLALAEERGLTNAQKPEEPTLLELPAEPEGVEMPAEPGLNLTGGPTPGLAPRTQESFRVHCRRALV